MKKVVITILVSILVCVQSIYAQDMSISDSSKKQDKNAIEQPQNLTIKYKQSPQKALLYSAIVPGLGQIYNRKYWKLPLVYGGYAALIYAISWNGKYYTNYKRAYISIADTDPSTNDYVNYIPAGQDISTVDQAWLEEVLRIKQLSYRSNRDLSIIGLLGFYGLTLLDAYVDAQLSDFDISPDLTVDVEPELKTNADFNTTSIGLRFRLKF